MAVQQLTRTESLEPVGSPGHSKAVLKLVAASSEVVNTARLLGLEIPWELPSSPLYQCELQLEEIRQQLKSDSSSQERMFAKIGSEIAWWQKAEEAYSQVHAAKKVDFVKKRLRRNSVAIALSLAGLSAIASSNSLIVQCCYAAFVGAVCMLGIFQNEPDEQKAKSLEACNKSAGRLLETNSKFGSVDEIYLTLKVACADRYNNYWNPQKSVRYFDINFAFLSRVVPDLFQQDRMVLQLEQTAGDLLTQMEQFYRECEKREPPRDVAGAENLGC